MTATDTGAEVKSPPRESSRKPPSGPGAAPAPAWVEAVTVEVQALIAERTPRLKIYEVMAERYNMPTRTVDDYIKRARVGLAAMFEGSRAELAAEALARAEDLIAKLWTREPQATGSELVKAERYRAELLGLVGSLAAGPSTTVNVAVGVAAAQPALAIDQWPADIRDRARAALTVLHECQAEATRRLAGGPQEALGAEQTDPPGVGRRLLLHEARRAPGEAGAGAPATDPPATNRASDDPDK